MLFRNGALSFVARFVHDGEMSRTNGSILSTLVLALVTLAPGACGDDGGNSGTSVTLDGTTDGDPGTTAGTSSDTATGNLPTTGGEDNTDDVVEIAIRRLNPGQDVDAFAAARDAFVALLKAQPGVGTDREFASFLDYAVFMPPDPPVFIGMTQYDSLADFSAAGAAVGASAEAGAFFSTFAPELFTVLTPLEAGSPVDLAGVADAPGQVLEIAVRDLSSYPNFDPADYAAKRDAFLALLAQQPGFVAEYQWVSALEPDIAVGMTVYASADAFAAIGMDMNFLGSPEVDAFIGGYPPTGGHVNAVIK